MTSVCLFASGIAEQSRHTPCRGSMTRAAPLLRAAGEGMPRGMPGARILVCLAAALGACAVLLVVGRSPAPPPLALSQFDATVRRQRSAWDTLDGTIAAAELQAQRPAPLSQLAARPAAHQKQTPRSGALSLVGVSLARQTDRAHTGPVQSADGAGKRRWAARNFSPKTMGRAWGAIDAASVDGRLLELRQIAGEGKPTSKKQGAVMQAKKEAKAKAKKAGKSTQKLAAAPPTSVADASIHNKGFYLASNKIKRGSNVIIYGTGATVNHQGGGVANSGGLGPKGGSGGGHSAAAGRPSPRAKSKA